MRLTIPRVMIAIVIIAIAGAIILPFSLRPRRENIQQPKAPVRENPMNLPAEKPLPNC
jgi:hypothetical protein